MSVSQICVKRHYQRVQLRWREECVKPVSPNSRDFQTIQKTRVLEYDEFRSDRHEVSVFCRISLSSLSRTSRNHESPSSDLPRSPENLQEIRRENDVPRPRWKTLPQRGRVREREPVRRIKISSSDEIVPTGRDRDVARCARAARFLRQRRPRDNDNGVGSPPVHSCRTFSWRFLLRLPLFLSSLACVFRAAAAAAAAHLGSPERSPWSLTV